MDNLLKFPQSTIVGKAVPKNAFWQRANNPTWLKEYLTKEFLSITWLYKLTAETLNVGVGKDVEEIDVFLCKMKGDYYSINPLCAMDKLLPRHTLFIIEYGESFDLIMHHKELTVIRGEATWRCGTTEMLRNIELNNSTTNTSTTNNSTTLHIEGQTMDAVYAHLLGQVAALEVNNVAEYERKVELRRQLRQIEKQIVTLQSRIRKERQFNRQVEMNGEARKLKQQAEELRRAIST